MYVSMRRNRGVDQAGGLAYVTRQAIKVRVRETDLHPPSERWIKCSRGIAEVRRHPDRLWRMSSRRIINYSRSMRLLNARRRGHSHVIFHILARKHNSMIQNFV